MAKWGSADFEQLQDLQKRLQRLQDIDLNKFCEDASKELAARLLALVIPRTPLGERPEAPPETETKNSDDEDSEESWYEKYWGGYMGGTLCRGWTAKTEAEAKSGDGSPSASQASRYAKKLPIEKSGDYYIIRVINPVEYASYVEFGHRQTPGRFVPAIGKRLKEGWVNGKYFLTLSEDDLSRMAPNILQKKLDKLLKEALNGRD